MTLRNSSTRSGLISTVTSMAKGLVPGADILKCNASGLPLLGMKPLTIETRHRQASRARSVLSIARSFCVG